MVQISEVKSSNRENRTSTHTHIKGLGLRPDGTAERQGAGVVGQAAAREVGSLPCFFFLFLFFIEGYAQVSIQIAAANRATHLRPAVSS